MKQGILVGEFMKTMSLEDAIRLAEKIGYEAVEIPASDVECKGKQYDAESARNVFDWARSKGLVVTSLQCHVGYSGANWGENYPKEGWKKRIEHTKKMIDIAQYTGVDIVHTVSGTLPFTSIDYRKQYMEGTIEITKGPEWNNIIQAYREICEYAKDKNVKVAIEPVFCCIVCNYETTKKLFDDLGRDDLYVNFDPGHLPYQREDVVPFIRDFGKKIVHCHVKDGLVQKENPAEIEKGDAFSMGDGEQFKFAAPGKGVLDWKGILAALREVGYNSVLSLEMGHGYEGKSEDIARDNLKFFQKII